MISEAADVTDGQFTDHSAKSCCSASSPCHYQRTFCFDTMKLPAGYVPGEGVYKATAYGGFGERLLKRMGWEEGRGLGINQHGLKKAIEVKKREDRSGVRDR